MSQPGKEAMKSMYAAVTGGDAQGVQRLLKKHPALRDCWAVGQTWLHHAAEEEADDPTMVRTLLDAGMDVNVGQENDDAGPLVNAIGCGNIQIARFLLEQGANPDQGRTLIAAANEGSLELVKLLLEHGAEINKTYPNELAEDAPMNALGQAIAYGHQELEQFLRAQGAVEPGQPASTGPSSPRAERLRSLAQSLGTVQPLALREIVPGNPSIDIHVIEPPDSDDYVTLLTIGMSDRAMAVPDGEEEYQYAELKINLPRDWPLSLDALQDPLHRWPIEWLRKIAAYPHNQGGWLGGASAIIANEEPPQPFAPNTRLSCWLLLTDETAAGRIPMPDGKVVTIYSLYPLYTEERDFELSHGIVPLLELLQSHNVPSWVDLDRQNVASQGSK